MLTFCLINLFHSIKIGPYASVMFSSQENGNSLWHLSSAVRLYMLYEDLRYMYVKKCGLPNGWSPSHASSSLSAITKFKLPIKNLPNFLSG